MARVGWPCGGRWWGGAYSHNAGAVLPVITGVSVTDSGVGGGDAMRISGSGILPSLAGGTPPHVPPRVGGRETARDRGTVPSSATPAKPRHPHAGFGSVDTAKAHNNTVLDGATVLQNLVPASAERLHFGLYSRSLKNPALRLLQEFPIGLSDHAEADFQHFRNVWSAGVLRERLYDLSEANWEHFRNSWGVGLLREWLYDQDEQETPLRDGGESADIETSTELLLACPRSAGFGQHLLVDDLQTKPASLLPIHGTTTLYAPSPFGWLLLTAVPSFSVAGTGSGAETTQSTHDAERCDAHGWHVP